MQRFVTSCGRAGRRSETSDETFRGLLPRCLTLRSKFLIAVRRHPRMVSRLTADLDVVYRRTPDNSATWFRR